MSDEEQLSRLDRWKARPGSSLPNLIVIGDSTIDTTGAWGWMRNADGTITRWDTRVRFGEG